MNTTEIMEVTFNIIYLIFIWLFVIKMTQKQKQIPSENFAITNKLRIGFFLLALGDTGHVGFRVIAFALGGLEQNSLLVGLGALCTAITITFLYMIILEVWRMRFSHEKTILYWTLILAGIIRLILFIPPQNDWGSVVPPFPWAIIRNLPLMIQGITVAVLIFKDAKVSAKNDLLFRKFAWAIVVSYAFYIPVILFVQVVPLIGMLMIPKTLAYMAMAYFTYKGYYNVKQ